MGSRVNIEVKMQGTGGKTKKEKETQQTAGFHSKTGNNQKTNTKLRNKKSETTNDNKDGKRH